MENPKVQFVLKGFSEVTGSRIFAFECVAADRSRTDFTVATDLALARRYGIRLQELPLLCKAILERKHEADESMTRTYTYTEADMGLYADSAAARVEAAKNRKPARRPVAANLGTAWRVPQP